MAYDVHSCVDGTLHYTWRPPGPSEAQKRLWTWQLRAAPCKKDAPGVTSARRAWIQETLRQGNHRGA